MKLFTNKKTIFLCIVVALMIISGAVYFMSIDERSYSTMLREANKNKQQLLHLHETDVGYSVTVFVSRHNHKDLEQLVAQPPKHEGACNEAESYCINSWLSLEKMDMKFYPSSSLGDKADQYEEYIRQVESDPLTKCTMQYFSSKELYERNRNLQDKTFTAMEDGKQLCVSPGSGLTIYTMGSF